MEEIKRKVKNVVNLDLNKSEHELFEAEYEDKEVIIKVVLNYNRGVGQGVIKRPECYINSTTPQEIIMYRYMMKIDEIASFIPKYYTSVVETDVDDFDKYWLLNPTEKERQENLGAYAYIIIEKINAEILPEIIRDEVNIQHIAKEIREMITIMLENGIIHGDIMSHNILVDKSGKAYLIDFDYSKKTDTISSMDIDDIVEELISDII